MDPFFSNCMLFTKRFITFSAPFFLSLCIYELIYAFVQFTYKYVLQTNVLKRMHFKIYTCKRKTFLKKLNMNRTLCTHCKTLSCEVERKKPFPKNAVKKLFILQKISVFKCKNSVSLL